MAEERGQWGNQFEFVLACVGYSVGLGNIWRFPYLAYENGGATFLIPYFISLLISGLPIYYLEMTLGQFSSLGPNQVFGKLVPVFEGTGWAMTTISFLVVIYYNVVIAWTFVYFVYSFRLKVPWASCTNDWNTFRCYSNLETERCSEELELNISQTTFFNKTCYNMTYFNDTIFPQVGPYDTVSSSEEFFNRHVLGLKYNGTTNQQMGFDDMGTLKWDVAVALFVAWVLVFLCLAKGVKSVGKVLYFTATFPYVILAILLVRGVTLDGAGEGLRFFLEPNVTKLAEVQVWRAAATQIFFSLGPGFGSLMTMASFNKFKNNCLRDAVLVACINCATSFVAGLAIFSVMGFMAQDQGVDVKDVVKSGPGLTFIAYPEAIARMWFPPLFAVLFFFMISLLGVDSQFAMVEVVTTGVMDQWKGLRRYKATTVGAVCFVLFLCGLPVCLNGGLYIFELLNVYAATYSLLVIGFIEYVTVSYFYGLRKFSNDLHLMMGKPQNAFSRIFGCSGLYWKTCWKFISPLYMLILIVLSFVFYKPIEVGEYVYPTVAEICGWLIVCAPIAFIVGFAIYHVVVDRFYYGEPWMWLIKATNRWCPAEERERIKKLQVEPHFGVNGEPVKPVYVNKGFDEKDEMELEKY